MIAASPSLPALATWNGHFVWPEDPDEVPLWRLAQEARAADLGIKLPESRTRRQHDANLALVESNLIGRPASAPAVEIDPLRTLQPHDAAETFVADLVALGEHGPHDDAQLRALYADHCTRYRLVPTAENMLRDAMRVLPGVFKEQVDGKTAAGKRQRKFVWLIATPEAEQDELLEVAA